MVLNYYDKLGSYTEESLANFRTNKLEAEATSLRSMINIFEGVGGMKIHSTYDYSEEEASEKINLDMIRQYLEKGIPVMVAWNDWGGHWQTIIGYDDLGTETTQDDVIIVADSYDTTDHNQDGYGIIPAERFYYVALPWVAQRICPIPKWVFFSLEEFSASTVDRLFSFPLALKTSIALLSFKAIPAES